ncbi:hypothetical protein F5Y17DRAFT_460189 [Xylariaceae sp. FL0594]|nr:hypothetical protein F5Y17DRAFT_460189 [Xylariaceae sp. FL0594]
MADVTTQSLEAKDDAAADSRYYISDFLYDMCRSGESVSSLMAEDPDLTPGEAWLKLMKGRQSSDVNHKHGAVQRVRRDSGFSDQSLERARACGKWGAAEPSDLFLRIYNDAICTLNEDPGRGVVSPSLLGSTGTIPLTIISVLPDIVRHMSNLIVRAEKEVFLATNFWQNSTASRYITNAIRELSKRVVARGDHSRVVMKVIYDRGNPRQIVDPHHCVQESEYTSSHVNLPPAKEISGVDLQVINYHQPVLGTFHAKYMVVDRKIGIVQSNNIQDNDNLEMMVQFEGQIVQSLYDMALLSWHKKLDPPLPFLSMPAENMSKWSAGAAGTSVDDSWELLFSPDGRIKGHSAVVDPAKMKARKPYGIEAATVAEGPGPSPPPQTSDRIWAEHTPEDPHYDTRLADEVLRVQAVVSAKPGGETAMEAVTRHLNHTVNEGYRPRNAAPECEPADEMTPYVPHPAQEPFPMALVNRAPYGRLSHRSLETPQNEAWLSALRNAQRSVFIQTPTLNAKPLIPAIIEACERGVDVFCYICLGYNDAGEMLPLQGGHNEAIAHKLYTASSLSPAGRSHLHWHWYVAKDQTTPVPAAQKKRSCHIKLLIADESVAIMGNGNQDTQSWFHSQEINVLVDSLTICRAWIDALRRNQNTGQFGELCKEDGIWRERGTGKEAEGVTGIDPGKFPWLKGITGAVKRVQGTGGF